MLYPINHNFAGEKSLSPYVDYENNSDIMAYFHQINKPRGSSSSTAIKNFNVILIKYYIIRFARNVSRLSNSCGETLRARENAYIYFAKVSPTVDFHQKDKDEKKRGAIRSGQRTSQVQINY